MRKNILHISPNFNIACGVSKHVYNILTSKKMDEEFNLYFVTNGGDALTKLDRANINYNIMNFTKDKLLHIDLFKNLKWLKAFCREKKINIIHSHHRYPELLANLIKKFIPCKTVITAHNFVYGMKNISYKSDCIVAVSHSVKNHLVNYFGLPQKKINVLYNCLNSNISAVTDMEELKKKLSLPNSQRIFLYIGRLSEEKGIDILIDSIDTLYQKNPNWLLIIVGSSFLELDIQKFNLNKPYIRVFHSVEGIECFYKIANLVILPSKTEGLGYTMLEAGLNKIPFIGSRAGGIAEFIEDGINGFLFEPGNSTDLADKINYLLNNPDIAKRSAERLNEKVLRLCNCENYFIKLSEIYDSLLTTNVI
ncbi:MAG: glycosyltransferase family 4 protein [Ignavibacteriaceae bacterium]|nr:glycosyltransferase family 4 protein [Ignavibacteriaceae bacterium]